jgi:hypothetical protein
MSKTEHATTTRPPTEASADDHSTTPTYARCETCTWCSRRFLDPRAAADRARLHEREQAGHRATTEVKA